MTDSNSILSEALTLTPREVPTSAVGTDATARRVSGLDSVRALCAFVVAIGHLGVLAHPLHARQRKGAAEIAIALLNAAVNAPAAVIIFFLISGFASITRTGRDGRYR